MKKNVLSIVTLLMLLCSVLVFAACSNESAEKSITAITVTCTADDVHADTTLDELKQSVIVTVNYDDGTSDTVTDFTLTGVIAEGENVITVFYQGFERTFTLVALGNEDALSHTHVMLKHEAFSATCVVNGNIEYWACYSCGKIFSDERGSNEIAVADVVVLAYHRLTHYQANAATCTEDGNIEYWSCSVCGKKYSEENAENEIDNVTVAASHSLTYYAAVSAPCTVGNIEYWFCSGCEKNFSDEDASTELVNVTVAASHTGGTEIRNQRAPTQTEDGYSGDVCCANCGEELESGKVYERGYSLISTASDLQNISLSGKYYLTQNIDLGGIEWTPIGTDTEPFIGILDGDGHVISNFKITASNRCVGFFGYSDGTIKNLGLESFRINVTRSNSTPIIHVGGLAGWNSDLGVVTSCYAIGSISATSKRSTGDGGGAFCFSGGLVGKNFGAITSSYASVTVSAKVVSSYANSFDNNKVYAGGLVGYNDAPITLCYATGSVSADATLTSTSRGGDVYAGGLIGYNDKADITDCYSTYIGSVKASISASKAGGDSYSGGLIGRHGEGNVTNCYAKGDVYADVRITGTTSSYAYAHAGGLIGGAGGTVTNCYATGDVSSVSSSSEGMSVSYAGGLIGSNGSSLSKSYATGNASSTASHSVTATSATAAAEAGGLVGENVNTAIAGCYATGNACANSSSGTGYAGGLIGRNFGTVENCYAVGTSSVDAYSYVVAGGLIGSCDSTSNSITASVKNCYATGDVSAKTSNYATVYAGGLIANNYGHISACYATGSVSTKNYQENKLNAGGLLSYSAGGVVTSCYRFVGQTFTVYISGNTTYEATNTLGDTADINTLKSAIFYTDTLGWSSDVWSFVEGEYPTLKNVATTN